MTRLSISLLGPFQVTLDDAPITDFESDKVRALLAYLAVEAEGPQRREKLAGLLWPDWPEKAARANLRHALAQLRRAIGDRDAQPSFLHVTRQSIQFNRESHAWVDVTAFAGLLGEGNLPQLEEAVALYRGSFLEGFSLADSAAFEEWALLQREGLQRQALTALQRLAIHHEESGAYERALSYARRQVELDPWQEGAHRQIMRALALSGQRGAALAQFETCRCLLSQELNVEPAVETTRLCEQIRTGGLTPSSRPKPQAQPPAFLDQKSPVESERPLFVARERELAQLDAYLDQALAGRGRVAFVTGGAGRGKTALIQAFAQRVMDAHPDLVVAGGNGNAYTGLGDPYLPFREALELLTGDVEARWAAGALSQEHARRLWHTLPLAASALVRVGPDLIDTFLPGAALVDRAGAYAPGGADWLTPLEELAARKAALPHDAGLQQVALFKQYTRVLADVARQRPLLLILDDLQWADLGSISLLFHLGRELAGMRVLLVGAYRPEEVAMGRNGERHPLEPVVNEFRRDRGEIEVALGQAEGRPFVEVLLDSEPNRLGTTFRETLYRQTGGHPLFTVELLRGLRERGDLVQDEGGRWVEGPHLDWETLPARVEAVIAERVGRLDTSSRQALRVASVEGETFTAEVVAQVQDVDAWEMVEHLSEVVGRGYRLVRAQGVRRVEGQPLSQYRFRHILFQRYLYHNLDQGERVYLHDKVGSALEVLYGEGADASATIVPQLARHFQEAGIPEKAVGYLRQAGERAVRLSAHEEAVVHFSQALVLLETLADSPERAQKELELRVSLIAPLLTTRGYAAPEVGLVCSRTKELCLQIGEIAQLFPVLWLLVSFYGARAEYQTALEIVEQLLKAAKRAGDPTLKAMAQWAGGWVLGPFGKFVQARSYLEQVIAFYDPHQHHLLAFLYGQDPAVACLSWLSFSLWALGYPDQALERMQEALGLAQELSHPFSLVFAQNFSALMHTMCGDGQTAQEHAEACISFSTKREFLFFIAESTVYLGMGLAEQGRFDEGIIQMRQGLAARQAIGNQIGKSGMSGELAEAYGKVGQTEKGLALLAEILTFVKKTGERYYEAELYRLKGELLQMQGADEAEVQACFWRAIEIAQNQQAKSWELRATMSLAQLWQKQGKVAEARQWLAEIYGWFSEGFDTADLVDAKALLEELA